MADRSRWVAAMTRTSTFDRRVRAQLMHFTLLQNTQELDLRLQRQFADLVQKNCAPIRRPRSGRPCWTAPL